MKPLKNKSYSLIFIFFSICYIIYHLGTLKISPVVWQDETFFNAITLDYFNNKTFFQTNCPLFLDGKQHLYYGPVFFILNGLIIDFWGNNIFQARLLGLICGIAILMFFYHRYKTYINKDNTIGIIIFIGLCFDPFFNASMHKGRNDTLALLFFLISMLFIFKTEVSKRTNFYFFLSAVFYSCCILTTSRMLVFSMAFMIYFIQIFISNFSKRKELLIGLLIWSTTLLGIFSIWIISEFHGYVNYVNYFSFIREKLPSHIFGRLFIPFEEYHTFTAFLLCLIALLLFGIKKLNDTKIVFYLSSVLSFYLLIGDVGPYSVLIIPFFYMIYFQVYIVFKQHFFINRIIMITMFSILLVNCSIFILKSYLLVASAEVRNHKNVEEFIKKHIPQNSRVVGDEVYYYATINNNCKFQYMHLHVNELSQIEKYRREVFNYDYLIYSKRLDLRSKDTINYYMQHSKLIKIAELKTEKPKSVNFLSRLNIYSLSLGGYDGVIYKRIKN